MVTFLRRLPPAPLAALLLLASAPGALAMPVCASGPRKTCVVDGDTLWVEGVKYRVEGIDAPELGTSAACDAEALLAVRAAYRLAEMLSAGVPAVERTGTDRYGRGLARLSVAGADVGERLIEEGLARRWTGRRESWCPQS